MAYRGPVHGEFSSSDASALSASASCVRFYQQGSATQVGLESGDSFVITQITIMCAAALTAWIYDGVDNSVGTGEIIQHGDFAATGGASINLGSGFVCSPGNVPKVKASGAGVVRVTMLGYIKGN